MMKNKLYGDGIHDDTEALQEMLSDRGSIKIPKGNYRITSTLIIRSDTFLMADKDARLFMCGNTKRKRGDFLISTDSRFKNVNISISGGVWDGNNAADNIKKADINDTDGYSGTVLNFFGVKNLSLENLTVINPAAYYIRLCMLNGFKIRNIIFKSEKLCDNQDGLHFCGEVRNGEIENIRVETVGQTGDDLIALNADDFIERVENLDMVQGDIENIRIKDVFSDDCYSFIRMLSVNYAIRNIRIDNVSGGCRNYAVNMDAGRYCRTPLFEENNRSHGVGEIENVTFNDFKVHWTVPTDAYALILCETQMDNLEINNFTVDSNTIEQNRKKPVLLVKNIYKRVIKSPLGKSIVINNKTDRFEYTGNIQSVSFARE